MGIERSWWRPRTTNKRAGLILALALLASVARWLEFSTSKMPAQPFMTPAWESHKEICRDEIIEKLASGIEEASEEK